jgi:dTMP kinase
MRSVEICGSAPAFQSIDATLADREEGGAEKGVTARAAASRPSAMHRPNAPGFLLVLEGIDGAGKSTLGRSLAAHLRSRGLAVVTSREPTDGPYGSALRQSAKTGRLSLGDELDLFLKDRAQHVKELVTPALERGEVVILDRYYISTAAYQGARGADPQQVIAMNEVFAPRPDLVLLLDIDPLGGTGRILRRGDQPDDFEAVTYLAKVREIFLSLPQPFIRRLDAALPQDEVFGHAARELDAALLEAGLILG